jgi:hypothetical protein
VHSPEHRGSERTDAIAYHSGALQDKIHSYKYEGKTGWSLIFGRRPDPHPQRHPALDALPRRTWVRPAHPALAALAAHHRQPLQIGDIGRE